MQFTLTKKIDLKQFGQELRVAADVTALRIALSGNILTIDSEDIDPALVQQVIDAHVPQPKQSSTRELARDSLKNLSPELLDSVVLDILRYLGLQKS